MTSSGVSKICRTGVQNGGLRSVVTGIGAGCGASFCSEALYSLGVLCVQKAGDWRTVKNLCVSVPLCETWFRWFCTAVSNMSKMIVKLKTAVLNGPLIPRS